MPATERAVRAEIASGTLKLDPGYRAPRPHLDAPSLAGDVQRTSEGGPQNIFKTPLLIAGPMLERPNGVEQRRPLPRTGCPKLQETPRR